MFLLFYQISQSELNLPGLDGVDQRAALNGESEVVPRDRLQIHHSVLHMSHVYRWVNTNDSNFTEKFISQMCIHVHSAKIMLLQTYWVGI